MIWDTRNTTSKHTGQMRHGPSQFQYARTKTSKVRYKLAMKKGVDETLTTIDT